MQLWLEQPQSRPITLLEGVSKSLPSSCHCRCAFKGSLSRRSITSSYPGEKMQKGVHLIEETDDVPEPFESFEEYRSFLLDYRDLLSRVVKLAASLLPEQALQVSCTEAS